MSQEILVERLFEALVAGDRPAARAIVQETANVPAPTVLSELFWPVHELIEKLHRGDQMTSISYQMSTRLLRMLVDQAAGKLAVQAPFRETVFAACGTSEGEELAAQIACDLLEANGFAVTFAGGGVPADELLAQVQERRPNILLLFASAASDLPGVRQIIDTLKHNGSCRETRVVVGGGVFNRADGLAQEIGASQWAYSPADLVDMLTLKPETELPIAKPMQTTEKAPVKVKRRMAA